MGAPTKTTRPIVSAEATVDKVTPGTCRLAFALGDREITLYVPKSAFGEDVPAQGDSGFVVTVTRKA